MNASRPAALPFQLSIKWANPEDTAIDSASLRELSNATLVTVVIRSGDYEVNTWIDRNGIGPTPRSEGPQPFISQIRPRKRRFVSLAIPGIAKETLHLEVRFYVGLLDAERNDFLTEPFKVKVAFARAFPSSEVKITPAASLRTGKSGYARKRPSSHASADRWL